MILTRIWLFTLILIGGCSRSEKQLEDLTFFENRFKIHFDDRRDIDDFEDKDAFYSHVAKQLGIPKIAAGEFSRREKLSEESTRKLKAVVRRQEEHWIVMLILRTSDDEVAIRFVEIDDSKKVAWYGETRSKEED